MTKIKQKRRFLSIQIYFESISMNSFFVSFFFLGEKGDKGDLGPPGPPGLQGKPGLPGLKGVSGMF